MLFRIAVVMLLPTKAVLLQRFYDAIMTKRSASEMGATATDRHLSTTCFM